MLLKRFQLVATLVLGPLLLPLVQLPRSVDAHNRDDQVQATSFRRNSRNLMDKMMMMSTKSSKNSKKIKGSHGMSSPPPKDPIGPSPFPIKSIDFNAQPGSTVQLVSKSRESPLNIFLKYSSIPNSGNQDLNPPRDGPWRKLQGTGSIDSTLMQFGCAGRGVACVNPTNGDPTSYHCQNSSIRCLPANDAGAAVWQIVKLQTNQSILLQIPAFTPGQSWRIAPIKKRSGQRFPGDYCVGNDKVDCGNAVLIEAGKDVVADMSAVDGVNFNVDYEMTEHDKTKVRIQFVGNPCRALNKNPAGCSTPRKDCSVGSPVVPNCTGSNWRDNDRCSAGTCFLPPDMTAYCDSIHQGQCANSSSTWPKTKRAPRCGTTGFTTYCWAHDDQNSQPYLRDPYKIKVTYSDLV